MINRYQTQAMADLWNDEARFERWTRVEVAACEAWHARGEIPDEEMEAIRTRAHHQSAARVREIERETHHDVVAFVRAVGESIGEPARRHVHRGLTSSDVIDTALATVMRDSLEIVIESNRKLGEAIAGRAIEHKHTPCAGRTHGIHAEPTTFGLRLCGWYTEVQRNHQRLEQAREGIAFGKLSGAVGNFSQTDPAFEAYVLDQLGLGVEPVATQVIPRDRHAEVIAALALTGASIERVATDIRSLQRTDIREVEEPFASGQTGSSAMPHKRNPIITERLSGMARLLRGYLTATLENVALWHERDISHSSVERVTFPDAFHLVDYMLGKLTQTVAKMRVYPDAMLANINKTRGLIFSQTVLGLLLEAGLERQQAYRLIQRQAMRVWEGEAEDLKSALMGDDEVASHVSPETINSAFDLGRYQNHVDVLFARAGIAEN